MSNALVTGPPDRVGALAEALRTEGFETVVPQHGLVELASRTPVRSIDGYVQLSPETGPARHLAQRLEAAATVASLLAGDATVLMVPDHPADPARDPRVGDALRVLAEATLAGTAKVSILTGTPSTVATALRREVPAGSPAPLADYAPNLGYADWRAQVLSLTSGDTATYFGWVNGEGAGRVGILRGSVVSPLATPPGVSWGDSGHGALVLARVLIAETFGADARCPCCQRGAQCGRCGGSGLNEWAADLAELLVKDVIESLPAEGFELPASGLEAWLRRWAPTTTRT